MNYKGLLCCFIGLSLFVCCNNSKTTSSKKDILVDHLDTTINPTEDFFDYANGGWIKNNPIPPDHSTWGIGPIVYEENITRLKKIIEKAVHADAANGTADQKIADFWVTAMDTAKITEQGLKPLQHYLDLINNVSDLRSLVSAITELEKIGSNTLFSGYAAEDAKKSDVISYQFSQAGIGLPDREYYFKNDSTTVNIRHAYINYISKVLTMGGEDSDVAKNEAKNVLVIETKLAKASRKREDWDPVRNYNKISIKDLRKMCAITDWTSYLDNIGVKHIDSVIVYQPEYFRLLENIIKSTSVVDWKGYLRFHLINDFAEALPEQFGVEAFHFNQLFSGAKERDARWKRVINSEQDAMGELIGQQYVKDYFNDKAKRRYIDLAENIRKALKNRIRQVTWMSDSTKQKAYIKLAAIRTKIGYPDKWKDLSTMHIGRTSYLENMINSRIWWHNYQINKLGKPVDFNEWDIYPQTNDAYYNGAKNEFVMPASIFSIPGFSDEELDDALVYGTTGFIMAHEITHAFDNGGKDFDEKGNLVNWWTKEDEEEFKKRANQLVKQFNEYEPIKDYHINGFATLDENIADLGGVLLSLDAYKETNQYKGGKTIEGYTPLQRYFLARAFRSCVALREEFLKSELLVNNHCPPKYRVNGALINVDDFYSAFNVRPGDKMYKADSLRVRIW
ncbi:MAG: M13 family metallopeptidase [Flavisolibacter sp.]